VVIEATGSMQWFVNFMEELGIEMPGRSTSLNRCAELRHLLIDWE
jgi:hypothetical protein